jgi:protein SCO1/2
VTVRLARPAAACVLSVALALAACSRPAPDDAAGRALTPESSAALPVLPIGGDFTLTDQDGRPFSLSSLRGNAVLIFFGYTMCPDACPTTLSKLSAAYARLTPDERARVKALYITIDPERDTPAVMKEHLSYFGVDAIGLTGTVEQTSKVAAQFGAHFEKTTDKTAAGYLMSHTVTVFGLDPQGRTRVLIDYEAGVDLVVREIRALLAAGAA